MVSNGSRDAAAAPSCRCVGMQADPEFWVRQDRVVAVGSSYGPLQAVQLSPGYAIFASPIKELGVVEPRGAGEPGGRGVARRGELTSRWFGAVTAATRDKGERVGLRTVSQSGYRIRDEGSGVERVKGGDVECRDVGYRLCAGLRRAVAVASQRMRFLVGWVIHPTWAGGGVGGRDHFAKITATRIALRRRCIPPCSVTPLPSVHTQAFMPCTLLQNMSTSRSPLDSSVAGLEPLVPLE